MTHHTLKHHSELSKLIEVISLYRSLTFHQVRLFFPDLKDDVLMILIKRLHKEGRLYYHMADNIIRIDSNTEVNKGIIAAFWVLLDFLHDVRFHTVSQYPVILTFFAKDDSYEIFYADEGKEFLLNHAISTLPSNDCPHRLIIITDEKQISCFTASGITAFCKIDENGNIKYYRKQGAD